MHGVIYGTQFALFMSHLGQTAYAEKYGYMEHMLEEWKAGDKAQIDEAQDDVVDNTELSQ